MRACRRHSRAGAAAESAKADFVPFQRRVSNPADVRYPGVSRALRPRFHHWNFHHWNFHRWNHRIRAFRPWLIWRIDPGP